MNTYDYNLSPERIFKETGPFFHVCCKSAEGIVFGNDQDRKAALVYLALTANETSAKILAYAIMSNHFHIIIATDSPDIFYARYKERVNRYLARHGKKGTVLPEEPTIVPILSLSQLLTEIAYVIRNQYVVDESVNPLSHIWCSGYLYFNPMLERFLNTSKYTLVSEMSGRKIMQLLNTKDIDQPFGHLKVLFDYPAPSSFVDYKLVEQLFKNARQFTNKVFKNVEAQIETAKMLGETPIVPDEEMSALMWKYCKDKWDAPGLNKLNSAQRVDLAKYMKYTYHSSNSQISRITSLPISSVNSLFPLSAK